MNQWTTVNASMMVTLFGGFAHHVMEYMGKEEQLASQFGPHHDPELGVNYVVRHANKAGEYRIGTNTIDAIKLDRRITRNR